MAIKLENGNYLIRDYGKYGSGLCFVSKEGGLRYTTYSPSHFNLPGTGSHTLFGIRGDFFVSKNGNFCFKVNEKCGKHLFLEEKWGGSWGDLNIYSELLPNKLYEKNTKSNGGRLGYYYVVIPVNTVYYPLQSIMQQLLNQWKK